jgi:hypothetical protein
MLANDLGHLALKETNAFRLKTSELGRIVNGLIASTKTAA